MRLKLHSALFTAGLMAFGYLITPAVADEWDKLTTFRFNQPVEVPGHVLVPGTYVFKLVDLPSDRDVVQVFSQDKQGMDHLITTAMAIPAYRVNTPEKPIVTFEERRSNNPEAVQTWFYPGDNYGWEFVYPKAEQLQVATNVTPAPAVSTAPVAPAPKPAVVRQPAVIPATTAERQESVVIAQNQPAAPSAVEPSANRELPKELPKQLPKTAGNLRLAETLGVLMLVSGAVVIGLGLLRINA